MIKILFMICTALPDELLVAVFRHFNLKEIVGTLSKVSKRWWNISQTDGLWHTLPLDEWNVCHLTEAQFLNTFTLQSFFTFFYVEMTLWQRKWERRDPSTVPATVAATLKEIDSGMYPNITECFKIFSTLPVTTCECERNVSALRRLKTYLRSTMLQTRLTGLALLHIHYNMDIDFDEIIRRFARLHPRRMQLANILSD